MAQQLAKWFPACSRKPFSIPCCSRGEHYRDRSVKLLAPGEQSRGRVLIVLAMSEQVGENSTPEPLQCSPGEQPRPATREKWPTE
jgi:hypothetical protein